MEDGRPTRTFLFGEAFKLGLTYLVLTALLFGISAIFSGSQPSETASEGFVGHSAVVVLVSGVLSFSIMSIAVWRFRGTRMIYNIIACFLISGLVSAADFFLTRELYEVLYAGDNLDFSISSNINDLFICWAGFFGWSSVFLTLLYSFDVRDRERRLAAVREEALSAQMRALRYQVNPHFLFNTLNSIAGLIEGGSATRAERMVISLSRFLRTTLTLDPFHDVRLSEELALQEEYLEIEHERFSDRMTFHIDVPDDVRQALVPSLILQPLIENAIKHGVGALVGTVNISLNARREADRLLVTVENDMPREAVWPKPVGMGVGLRNVSERLRARFQDDGRLSAGPAEPGLYRATLDMPWRVG
ncbi:sensor histidine kinase [Oryzibacter oryziterrae]|uniref:sensor histidine kinase n=1 Tax=Oryzibacter oryziterrae TaxID=2766474 RepID=UPI001F005729|nr:histidine kinase [Oryzibacter oryziterrae]